jgi:uncharacterized protein (UPF0333 family)
MSPDAQVALMSQRKAVLPARSRGQSMTEFIIVLPVLLLLVLGAIQFGLIYHAKATLNRAAFETARAGALNQGKAAAMTLGLANGLRPLFTYNTDHGQVISGFNTAKQEANTYARVEVINPNQEAISYWKGHIPNDNLIYARAATPTGITLQDANLLKVKVTYCYSLQILLLRDTIVSLARINDTDPFNNSCYDAKRLPIVAQGIVRMQSDYCPAC